LLSPSSASKLKAHWNPKIDHNLRSLMVRRVSSIMTAAVVAMVVMTLFILSGFIAGLRAIGYEVFISLSTYYRLPAVGLSRV
jgi:hypothetical protein